jgi:hypothetical protein
MLNKLPPEKVRRKMDLCDEYIQVFEKLEPGESTDWWAATTYEAVQVSIL